MSIDTYLGGVCVQRNRYDRLLFLRPFIMRSDSQLLIFIFRSEKEMGLFMQTDFAESDGIESDLIIR